jgi:Fe-S cluster assembly iron-binding protein IscA
MIGITERAKDVLVDLRQSVEVADPHAALRLAPNTTGQLELSVDVERDGDEVLQHEGAPLLVIAGNVSQGLTGSTIDCTQTPGGVQLTLNRFPGRNNGEPSQ